MKNNKPPCVCVLLFILSSATALAQQYSIVYNTYSLALRSDFPSKSVLLSDMFSDKVADKSPFIGAALWSDSGRQFECRSLLEFNYLLLAGVIINDPSMITSAELILYPVQPVPSRNDMNMPGKLTVRRVLESWEDSATTWISQPSADSSRQVIQTIKTNPKGKPVSIDVTRLVSDMLRSRNNGFMLCYKNSPEQAMASGQWFASPKNDDENLRPLLIINYRKENPFISQQFYPPYERMQRQIDPQPQRSNTEPGTEPVKQPKETPVKPNTVQD